MRKVLLSLILPSLLGIGPQLFGQCNPFFFDGFETGTYSPTWTLNSGIMSWSVSTSNPASGSYRLQASGGSSTHLNGLSTSFSAQTPGSVSWWIYPTGNVSTSYVVLGNSSVSANNCISFCYWQGSGGNIRFVSSSNFDYPCTPDQWYHIEMRNINFAAHTFDIYINGNLQQTGFPFRSNTQNDLSVIHLYNYNNGTGIWDNITVGNASPLQLSSVVNNVSCNGGNNGSVNLTASSSNPGPLSYLWSTGINTEDITGLSAGSYSVVVTDASGCSDSLTGISVAQPAAISNTISFTPPLCNGGSDATASITSSGGTPGYSYQWMNQQTTATIQNLNAGMVYCQVTDANGCTVNDTAFITEPAALDVSFSTTAPATCTSADGSITANASGGTAGYTYAWNTGTNGNILGPVGAGNYSLTLTDANNCNASFSVTLSNPPGTPVALEIPQDSVCIQYAPFNLAGASMPGGTYSGNGVNTGLFNPAAAGLGQALITYTYTDSNNCVSTATDEINVMACLGTEPYAGADLRIYPNPFGNMLNIQATEAIQRVEWLDAQGKLIRVQALVQSQNQLSTDTGGLPAGIYLLRVITASGAQVHKLIKQ